jgi:trigger factor
LEYEIIKDDEVEKEIDFSVPATELQRFVDIEVDKIQKDLTIKGFRKGKVPKDIIKSRYHDTLKAQAVNSLVTETFLKILEEKNWRPASQAQLQNLEQGEKITFRLHFETIPELDVGDYIGLEIFKEEPLPDDFLLQQGLNDLRERHAAVKEVSRPAVVDDFVTMNLRITEDNKVTTNKKSITVKIGDRGLPDEINKALVGARKSEEIEVTVGNQHHSIMIKKIEEKILPQIDDEFAKSQNYKDVEQLKQKLMEQVKHFEEKRVEAELKDSLSAILLERNKATMPNTLIDREYQKVLTNSNLPDSEANKERFWSLAERRARLNLILDKIAEKENIMVKEEEIMNVVSSMGWKLSNENRENVIEYIGSILNREKTIDFLFKKAKVSKKSRIISPKEASKNDTSSVRH